MPIILKGSEPVEEVSWRLNYTLTFHRGAGWSFDCDEKGNINESKLTKAGKSNLDMCRNGQYTVDPPEISKRDRIYYSPMVIQCQCGKTLAVSDSWENPCECGRNYDGSGNELAPRALWGDEFITRPEGEL